MLLQGKVDFERWVQAMFCLDINSYVLFLKVAASLCITFCQPWKHVAAPFIREQPCNYIACSWVLPVRGCTYVTADTKPGHRLITGFAKIFHKTQGLDIFGHDVWHFKMWFAKNCFLWELKMSVTVCGVLILYYLSWYLTLFQEGNDFGEVFDGLAYTRPQVLLVKLQVDKSHIKFSPSFQECWEVIQGAFMQIIQSAEKLPRVKTLNLFVHIPTTNLFVFYLLCKMS